MEIKHVTMLWAMTMLFIVAVTATSNDEPYREKQDSINHEPAAKKDFMPWLLRDFKITKEGVTLSVTKEKADYFNLYHRGNEIVLEDASIFLKISDNKSLGYSRSIAETSNSPERSAFFNIYYGKIPYEIDDGDEILKELIEKYPHPLKVLENYSKFHRKEEVKKRNLKSSLDWRIYEKQYIFPVLKDELDDFLKLVPKDKFRSEIYDGFVVLHRIHSKEEAEKRKDFLLITNGTSKGMWDIVEEYKGERQRPKPIYIDILNPEEK